MHLGWRDRRTCYPESPWTNALEKGPSTFVFDGVSNRPRYGVVSTVLRMVLVDESLHANLYDSAAKWNLKYLGTAAKTWAIKQSTC